MEALVEIVFLRAGTIVLRELGVPNWQMTFSVLSLDNMTSCLSCVYHCMPVVPWCIWQFCRNVFSRGTRQKTVGKNAAVCE